MTAPSDSEMAMGPALLLCTVIDIAVPVFFYGIYTSLYLSCLGILKSHNTPWKVQYLLGTTALFLLSTVTVILNCTLVVFRGFNMLGGEDSGTGGGEYTATLVRLWRVSFSLYIVSNVVADMILISRCYLVWKRSVLVVLFPTVLCLASNALGLSYVWGQMEYFLGLGQVFGHRTAWEIICLLRRAEKFVATEVQKMYRGIIAIIIESGVIYPIALIILIGLGSDTMKTYIGKNVVLFSLVQIVGIAPTLIIVRIGRGQDVQARTHHFKLKSQSRTYTHTHHTQSSGGSSGVLTSECDCVQGSGFPSKGLSQAESGSSNGTVIEIYRREEVERSW
ncbi:hypothetical protein L218DRAFT_1016057 [Marasmius fiardii PR-910]|nr:hypothetical protein L218DRAFT_1016057 [Marasmius fiardii PR-910]